MAIKARNVYTWLLLDQRTSLVLKQYKYMSAHNSLMLILQAHHTGVYDYRVTIPKDYSIIQSIGKCSLYMEFHKRTIDDLYSNNFRIYFVSCPKVVSYDIWLNMSRIFADHDVLGQL